MQDFGNIPVWRLFYRTVLYRWRLLAAVVSVLALLAGLLIGFETHAGRVARPAGDAVTPVAVHAVKGQKVYVPAIRPYRRPPTSWPAARATTVTVSGSLTRAGGTPVYVGPAEVTQPHATAATTGALLQVRVTVAAHQTAEALGVRGLVFAIAPGAGSPGGRIHISVDYSGFAGAYGGDFAGRLHLVELPACALTNPQVISCRRQLPVRVAAGNNGRAQRVGGDVTLAGATAVSSAKTGISVLADTSSTGVVLAVTAAASGDGGNFTVTPVSEASEWVNGSSSGTFSYSYPVQVPPVPGGFAPDVRLQYSSQLTDGLTSAANTQASWVGDGWDYIPGYIETDYPMCGGDASLTQNAGDWCASLPTRLGTPPMTLSLNGTQSPIVQGVTGLRAEADSGATFASGPNGSMIMTQRNGTRLYFGLNQLPGWASGDAVTSSQWTVPLFNPPTGPGSTGSWSTGTWRLMLDYEVDRHGNAIAFYYSQQQNWYAEAAGTTGTGQYTRDGTLSKITYGFQDGHAYDQTPPGEVDFSTGGGRQDAPADLACAQNQACSVTSPTFWNDQQLTGISAKALVGPSQEPVDRWALSQAFPTTGDPLTGPSLWLSSITQTGQDGTTPITLPPTQFAPTAAAMPNRVTTATDTTAGYSPISRFRLGSITNPTGAVTTIKYTPADPACAAGNFPAAASNATQCYPNSWLPPGTTTNPVQDWWNVYAVASKTVSDTTGGDPPVVTSYTNAGPGWHYDNDTVSRSAMQTFDEWRGFRTITTEIGTAPDAVTDTADTYFQGLSKDCAASSCPTASPLTLTSSRGTTAEDSNGLAGMTFEEITYDGAGSGNEVTDTIHNAGITATTATGTGPWAGVTANIVNDNGVATYTTLSGGGVRESQTSYAYDKNGLLTGKTDEPDVSDSSQWTCTTTTYGPFDLVTEEDIYSFASINGSQACTTLSSAATVAQMQAGAVSAISNTYDTAGNLTQMQKGTGVIPAGTSPCPANTPKNPHVACWNWQTTLTSTYDAYGRVLTSADGDNRTTTTAYTPAAGAEPVSVKVTDPMGLETAITYDPVRNLALTATDPAGYQTAKTYDALGRVTAEWTPGNPTSGPAVDTYSYTVSNTAPSYTVQQTEMPGGGYLTTVSLSDSLGQSREVQQQTAAGGSDVSDTSYNSDGLKALSSNPYYVSSAPSGILVAAANSSIPSQTGYVYDGDRRVIRQIAYKYGTEAWETDATYGGNFVTVVPPSGGTSQTTFTDGRQLIAAVYQYHANVTPDPSGPPSGYDKTTYTYTAAKKLAGIADAAGNNWSFTYDLLGNQLTQVSPDSGTNTSAYDAAGQVMSVTDARGKTIAYAYDSDGRKTAKYDITGGALESPGDELASWTYDTLAKGKPTSSTSYENGAAYSWEITSYNTHGLPSATATIIPSAAGKLAGTYTRQYTYATTGQTTSYTDSADGGLPSETVTTGYDSAGEASSLNGASSYVNTLLYTNLGQPMQYTLGAASQPLYVTKSWDPQTGKLVEQNTQVGTAETSVDDLHYSYDSFGNVTSEADTPAGASGATDVQCFQTDYLGRLVQAWAQAASTCASGPSASAEGGAAPYWNSYTYDVTGNITKITSTDATGTAAVKTFTYPSPGRAQPHAFSSESLSSPSGSVNGSYSYDQSGDLISLAGPDQAQTLTWDDQGKLTQDAVTPSGSNTASNTTYIYDAEGRLLLVNDPGHSTLYLDDEELSLDTSNGTVTGTRAYGMGSDSVLATRTGGSIAYLADDAQGTTRVAIDASTLNVTRRWYDPYGNPRGTAPSAFPTGHKGFVGGAADASTSLTNLGAREYQPATASFIKTDPVLKPYDPQDLNPYAYAEGNPATRSDPSGTCNPKAVNQPGCHPSDSGCTLTMGVVSLPCDYPNILQIYTDYEASLNYWSHGSSVAAQDPQIQWRAWYSTCGDVSTDSKKCGKSLAQATFNEWASSTSAAGVMEAALGKYFASMEAARGVFESNADEDAGLALSLQFHGCNSFSGQTVVLLANGNKQRIGLVKAGAKVLATDPLTGKSTIETVIGTTITSSDRDFTAVTVKTGGGSLGSVISTSHHLYWDATSHAWTSADNLKTGDRLASPDRTVVTVYRIQDYTDRITTYNLTVANIHTYYVVAGRAMVLVHNCDAGAARAEIIYDHAQEAQKDHGGTHSVRGWDPESTTEWIHLMIDKQIPGEQVRSLSGGRVAYWDPHTGALVITQGSGGTFLTPSSGYQYFLNLT